MTKKLLAVIVLVMITSLSVAGCTSSTSSNQAASNTPYASATSSNAPSPSTTPSPSVVLTPTPTATPTPTPSPTIQVIISGPTTLSPGQGGTWTATVLANGVPIPQSQLTGKMYWFIDGHYAPGNHMNGSPLNSATFISDANGESTAWAPHGVHTLNAEYLGDPSLPNTSITVVSS